MSPGITLGSPLHPMRIGGTRGLLPLFDFLSLSCCVLVSMGLLWSTRGLIDWHDFGGLTLARQAKVLAASACICRYLSFVE